MDYGVRCGWYGMVWYGVYGIVWYGVYGTVWYGMVCMVWYGTVWGMVWWRNGRRFGEESQRRNRMCLHVHACI